MLRERSFHSSILQGGFDVLHQFLSKEYRQQQQCQSKEDQKHTLRNGSSAEVTRFPKMIVRTTFRAQALMVVKQFSWPWREVRARSSSTKLSVSYNSKSVNSLTREGASTDNTDVLDFFQFLLAFEKTTPLINVKRSSVLVLSTRDLHSTMTKKVKKGMRRSVRCHCSISHEDFMS